MKEFTKSVVKVNQIRKLLEEEIRKNNADEESDENEEFFPLSTVEDLEKFNNILINDSIARKKFKCMVQKIDGHNLTSHTNETLRRVIADDLAIMYSYSGQTRGKKRQYKTLPFKNLKLFKVLRDAIVSSRVNYTEREFIEVVKRFLNCAKYRIEKKAIDDGKYRCLLGEVITLPQIQESKIVAEKVVLDDQVEPISDLEKLSDKKKVPLSDLSNQIIVITHTNTMNLDSAFDQENQGNHTIIKQKDSFHESFTLPVDYLPKTKKAKVLNNGKKKLPAVGTSEDWLKIQVEKERQQKIKEDKLHKKKELQLQKKILSEEKKKLQEQMKLLQKKIKVETS